MTPAKQPKPSRSAAQWVEERVEVPNPQGFHLRPATQVVALANTFEADVRVRRGEDDEVDAKVTLPMMGLAAKQGTPFTIRARGDDAEKAVADIGALFRDGFGEMDAQ